MMANSTHFSSFILSAYFDNGPLKYFYFTIITSLYFFIIFVNTFLIAVICLKKFLHEPMYIFLASLFANELYGSTGLFPLLMIQLLSDTHTISISYCFTQMFFLYTYAFVEFNNLAVMAYDRYLAICCPLYYKMMMTPSRVGGLICLVWLYSFLRFVISLFLTIQLQLCGNVIDSVYCNNYLVVKLACFNTSINNVYGLCGLVLSIAVPLIPILFSYVTIFKVCLKASKETQQKAINTCAPHLASLLNFSFGCFFEIVQTRFNMTHVPSALRIALSLYFLICQPLFSPIVYGVRMSKIRKVCRNMLFCDG